MAGSGCRSITHPLKSYYLPILPRKKRHCWTQKGRTNTIFLTKCVQKSLSLHMLPVTQLKSLVLTGWLSAPSEVNGILRREVYVAIFDLRLFSTPWLQSKQQRWILDKADKRNAKPSQKKDQCLPGKTQNYVSRRTLSNEAGKTDSKCISSRVEDQHSCHYRSPPECPHISVPLSHC